MARLGAQFEVVSLHFLREKRQRAIIACAFALIRRGVRVEIGFRPLDCTSLGGSTAVRQGHRDTIAQSESPPHSLTRTGAASSSEFNLFAWIKTSPFGGDWRFDSVPIPVGPKDRQRQTERRQTGIQTATQRQRQRQRGPRVMSPRDYFARL